MLSSKQETSFRTSERSNLHLSVPHCKSKEIVSRSQQARVCIWRSNEERNQEACEIHQRRIRMSKIRVRTSSAPFNKVWRLVVVTKCGLRFRTSKRTWRMGRRRNRDEVLENRIFESRCTLIQDSIRFNRKIWRRCRELRLRSIRR